MAMIRSEKSNGVSDGNHEKSRFGGVSSNVFNAVSIRKVRLEKCKNDFKYQCLQCHKCFSGRSSLWIHKNGAKFPCEQCDKSFCGVKSVTHHVCVPSKKPKRFACDESGCDYSTNLQGNLKNHHVTHTGERPHPCPFRSCNRAFGLLGNMKKHILICKWRNLDAVASSSSSLPSQLPEPTAERKQIECGVKSFTHHDCVPLPSRNRKRFVCDESGCNYSTNTKQHMKYHHMTHTGKRLHPCPFKSCNRAFSHAGNLNQHVLLCNLRNLDAETSSSSLPAQLPEPTAELKQIENRVAIRTKPSIDETIKTPDHIDCNVSVLWCLRISIKLQAHREQQDKLLTKTDIGKMLSDAVVGESPDMDWNKPFLLLDFALDLGDQPVVKNNIFIRIPVVEKSTPTPSPYTKEFWQLELSHCLIDVGKEMLRCPDMSKTIMIWGARRYLYEKPLQNSPFVGVIRLNDSAVANLLIFREIRDYEVDDTIQIDLNHWNHRIERNYDDEIAAVHLSNIETHKM